MTLKWFRVDKSKTLQPEGKYSQWKGIVRDECLGQCVYCAINEAGFGGVRNFHIDHYRPKKTFDNLRDAISNLFYACSICNSFKGADWPAEPISDHSVPAYPNPSEIDYSEIFEASARGVVTSRYAAGRYVIERLYINRPQMIMARRRMQLVGEIERDSKVLLDHLSKGAIPTDLMPGVADILNQCIRAVAGLQKISPYEPEDAARPK